MSNGEQFLFVGGAGRSGTTLLQNILDSHPAIIGGPEFRNIPHIIGLRNRLHESLATGRTTVFGNSFEDIDYHIRTLIENLLTPLLKRHNCKVLSEKTPQNIFVFSELSQLFPKAHYIFMIRDPRAVIHSQMLLRRRQNSQSGDVSPTGAVKGAKLTVADLLDQIKHVKSSIRAGMAVSNKGAATRVLTVVYERLVANPESETKRICRYLGLEWSSAMVRPSRQSHIGEEAMTVGRSNYFFTKDTFNRDPDPTDSHRWKSQLTLFQKAVISSCFSDLGALNGYGYDLSPQNMGEKAVVTILLFSRYLSRRIPMFYRLLVAARNLKTYSPYLGQARSASA